MTLFLNYWSVSKLFKLKLEGVLQTSENTLN